jgi:beta-lactamase class D
VHDVAPRIVRPAPPRLVVGGPRIQTAYDGPKARVGRIQGMKLRKTTIRSPVALLAAAILCAVLPARVRGGSSLAGPVATPGATETPLTGACFLLHEIGGGAVRREPSSACQWRVTPASTFKIAHALAALDAGIVSGPDARFKYDGRPVPFESWNRDHTLASAMCHSVVWYFQRLAEALGIEREREYLQKFAYGNADPGDDLTTFWLGGPLLISPDEQLTFLLRFYQDSLPVKRETMRMVRRMLVQPKDRVVSARGERSFGAPWPEGTVLGAKTGSATDRSGRQVRWLLGRVSRGRRSWIFVSCVIGSADLAADAAVDLAASALHEESVL